MFQYRFISVILICFLAILPSLIACGGGSGGDDDDDIIRPSPADSDVSSGPTSSADCPEEDKPKITSTPATTAEAGKPYLYDEDGIATAAGQTPIFWSVDEGDISGLSIAKETGQVEWTPSSSGEFEITINATNA
jgi:hypothetical protein